MYINRVILDFLIFLGKINRQSSQILRKTFLKLPYLDNRFQPKHNRILNFETFQNWGEKKRKKRKKNPIMWILYLLLKLNTSFAKYLFILENKVWHFQINFFRISTVEEQVCKKYNLSCAFCNSNHRGFQFSIIWKNNNKIF